MSASALLKPVVLIVQSCYIPWKGYFDLINQSDIFIVFDEVQYTRRDWRNRNRILTRTGAKWLTIPVKSKGNYELRISQMQISNSEWAEQHWQTLSQEYARAPFFKEYRDYFADLYEQAAKLQLLSEINVLFLKEICHLLEIKTQFVSSADFALTEGKTERLVGLCKRVGASTYISGPAAKDYIDEELFVNQGIELVWADYGSYPIYKQMHEPFDHAVTVLDLLFNTGPAFRQYMKSY